jgi:hypothetical protein
MRRSFLSKIHKRLSKRINTSVLFMTLTYYFISITFINILAKEVLGNHFIDYSIELNSIGAESNCTSVGTQTHSRDANIQTTHSLESIESPSELNDKFCTFSNKHARNHINYNRLDNSEFIKAESSLESSVKDESTQCRYYYIAWWHA